LGVRAKGDSIWQQFDGGAGEGNSRLDIFRPSERVPPALDELDFSNVDRLKLLNYARRFPRSTYLHVLPALVGVVGVLETIGAGAGAGD